ncbi:hypothetical protein HPB48_013836 [Haemaphysalis longicornis]|uniref:Uncharacterized protein n=1 Tax=Haemaphysalis longicornis TaxID=44386 RepID=A0A9J6GAQ1_HAELO|nr:hypothetical protein HPB48_013836 [Haemaphysalis longicornis]
MYEDAFQDFLRVKAPVKRYVSLPVSLFTEEAAARSPVVRAASRFLVDHALSGVELAARREPDLSGAVPACQDLHRIHPDDISLLLRISASINSTAESIKDISTLVDKVIFETQQLRLDAMPSVRFANPYLPFENALQGDVFMVRRERINRESLSRVWSLRQAVGDGGGASRGWCFTLSLGAIKNYRDTLYGNVVSVVGYDYVSLPEVCALLKETHAETNNDSVSRYVKTDYVFYTFDDRDTIFEKASEPRVLIPCDRRARAKDTLEGASWTFDSQPPPCQFLVLGGIPSKSGLVLLLLQVSRILSQFPNLCLAAYDVELDDVDGYCQEQGVDVGAPLLELLHAIAFRRAL